MPACYISYMKFLFVLAKLGACSCTRISVKQMHFANSAALAAALFTTLIENFRLCSSVKAGLFLNFEQK